MSQNFLKTSQELPKNSPKTSWVNSVIGSRLHPKIFQVLEEFIRALRLLNFLITAAVLLPLFSTFPRRNGGPIKGERNSI